MEQGNERYHENIYFSGLIKRFAQTIEMYVIRYIRSNLIGKNDFAFAGKGH